ALTWRRIQASPQITAITIASPTIVRTMLAPPVLVVWVPALEGLRFSGVFSPPLLAGGVNAEAGHANASRQKPSTATTCAAARKSGGDLVIKDDSEEESLTVIGPDV